MPEHWITRIYRTGLVLFPAGYQEEYGDELLYAIRMAVEQARRRGWISVARLAWRELRDLPGAILQAQLKERRRKGMKIAPGYYLPEGPIERWKLAAVFLPFAVFLLGVLVFSPVGSGVQGLTLGAGVLLLGLLVAVWAIGLVQGFPTWALPALGLVVAFVGGVFKYATMVLKYGLGNVMQAVGWPDSIYQRVIVALASQLYFVVLMALLVGGLLLIVPSFRQRVRQDWSLLSLLLYGLALPPILFMDEFHGLELYQLASLLLLTGGAWLFLIAPRRQQRLLALLLPVVLAPVLMSVGMYRVFPAQPWAGGVAAYRLWESIQPVLGAPALAALLCLPALFIFINKPQRHEGREGI